MHIHVVVTHGQEKTNRVYTLPKEFPTICATCSGKCNTLQDFSRADGLGTQQAQIAKALFDLEGVEAVEFSPESVQLWISPYCCPSEKDLQVRGILQTFAGEDLQVGLIWPAPEAEAS